MKKTHFLVRTHIEYFHLGIFVTLRVCIPNQKIWVTYPGIFFSISVPFGVPWLDITLDLRQYKNGLVSVKRMFVWKLPRFFPHLHGKGKRAPMSKRTCVSQKWIRSYIVLAPDVLIVDGTIIFWLILLPIGHNSRETRAWNKPNFPLVCCLCNSLDNRQHKTQKKSQKHSVSRAKLFDF